MVSYADLDGIVKKLKRAAIDAYMHENHYLRAGDVYTLTIGTYCTVTRPGEDGEGGGQWDTSDPRLSAVNREQYSKQFIDGFATIRAAVDAAVAPWRDLPDPVDIAKQWQRCHDITEKLAVSAGTSDSANGPQVEGDSELGRLLHYIDGNSSHMVGGMISAFRDKFLRILPSAVNGLRGVSMVLEFSLAGEQEIWTRTRQDAVDIIDKARQSMDKICEVGPTDWKFIFTLAGWAVAAVAIVASGATVTPLLAAGKLTFDVAKTSMPETPHDASTYASVMKALTETLNDLNQGIRDAETALDKNQLANLQAVHDNKSSFDMQVPVITDTAGSGTNRVSIDEEYVAEITDNYLPAASTELEIIAQAELAAPFDVTRDASLGFSVSGPSTHWYQLSWLLYELLRDLSWETQAGAANLRAAVADFKNQDAASQAALDQTAAAMAAGGPYHDVLYP